MDSSEDSKHYLMAMNALNKSISDTEKFAALFVVSNLLKDKQLNRKQTQRLFESIESKFLCRLLLSDGKSGEIPDECQPYVYQSIGVSIITSFFMTIIDLIDSKTCLQILTSMTEVLKQLKDNKSLDEIEKQMLNDIIICFESFFSSDAVKQFDKQLMNDLFESKFADILLEIYSNNLFNDQNIYNLLSKIANSIEWSEFDSKSFNQFMTQIAVQFKAKHDKQKFELCEQLNSSLKRNSIHCIKHNIIDWINPISDALFDIYRSKINKQLRDPALRLTATLTEMFEGFDWISNKSWNERKAKNFLLLLRLCCIEISINFESENIDMSCVANCFVIIEYSVITIANDSEEMNLIKHLTQEEIYDMLTAVKDMMSIIIEYLRRISIQTNEIDSESDAFISTLASIRVLFVWVTEETEALREEIAEILPFILKVLRKIDLNNESLVNIVISALISLAENDKLKSILIQENIIQFIDKICVNDSIDSSNETLKQLLLS
jgi:hypothetical protein